MTTITKEKNSDSIPKKRVTIRDIAEKKKNGEKIPVITSYDYAMASICDRAGIDILMVGDSAGMVMLGYENTMQVSMEEMCIFTGAVNRARKRSLIVADLPFMSYQTSVPDAIANAGRLVKAGADAVKLEGGSSMSSQIRGITGAGIPVMGHIGLLPQTAGLAGGYRVQGRTAEQARTLIDDAVELEAAGAFAIVLEMVAQEAAAAITARLSIPTIGIGSGSGCDGQVLVIHDMLGMYDEMRPKFAKQYCGLSEPISGAISAYVHDVQSGAFPTGENSFLMGEGEPDRI